MKELIMRYKKLSVTKKAIIWFTLATIVQKAISFIVTPILTRILSDDEYGTYSVFQSWQQIFSVIVTLSLDRCITIGFVKYENKKEEFLSSIQVLTTIIVILFGIIIYFFKNMLLNIINLPIYIVYIMLINILLSNVLANWSWLQRYEYKYIKLSIITVCSSLIIQITAILSIIFIPNSNKGISMIIGMVLASVVLYGMIYINVLIKGKKYYKREYWIFALRYSITIIPHALSQIVLSSSDRIMIDNMCGRAEAAYYGVTYSAGMILNIIIMSLNSAVQPWFYQKIKEKKLDDISRNTNKLLLLIALLAISVSFIAPEILAIMAPNSYSSAVLIFPSVAASTFFYSMYLYFANFESYFEKPIYISVATITGAIINIILNYLLLPIFGFIVAGYTTLICYIIFAIMHYIFMRKVCKSFLENSNPFDNKFLIVLSIIVSIFTIAISLLYKYTIIRYFIFMILIIISIIVLLKNKKILNLKPDKNDINI